jgi:hypothetical protein
MDKIRISENELKQIINESVMSILKENFDYNYGSRNIEIIREIYQLSLKIDKIAEDFGNTPISLYTEDIMNLCMELKKNLLNNKQ